MINKSIKNNRKTIKNFIFAISFLSYMAGICCCFIFLTKNSDNLAFVSELINISDISKMENTAILARMVRLMCLDFIYLLAVLVFKYSGILKGMVLSPIFICSFIKTCSYCAYIHNGYKLFEIMTQQVIKDCTVAFLLITYCYVVINEIFNDKYRPVKDIKKLVIYCTGIFVVYMINCAVIILF